MAQPFKYGNEWINYGSGQKYYKIKVAQDGIYRIDSTALAAAGFQVGAGPFAINPQNFQLFNKGVEQYIYIQGESDGVFNSGDFIEFHGKHNDAALDSSLYTGISYLTNPYYSLFNDTATYYLHLNTASTTNRRMIVDKDTTWSNPAWSTCPYFMCNSFIAPSNTYYPGEDYASGLGISDPQYTVSEGYFDAAIYAPGSSNYSLSTKNVFLSPLAPPPQCTIVFVGASQDGGSQSDHEINIQFSGSGGNVLLKDTLFYGYQAIKLSNKNFSSGALTNAQLGASSSNFKFSSLLPVMDATTNGRAALSYISLWYPHTFSLENAKSFLMGIPDSTALTKYLLNISNLSISGDSVRLYDLVNHRRILVGKKGNGWEALVTNFGGTRRLCYITGDQQIQRVTSIVPVGPVGSSTPGVFTDFQSIGSAVSGVDSAFLIVTHHSLWAQASAYGNYRQSLAPVKRNVVIADVDELYDQYAFGIVKDPIAIRGFANLALDKFHTPPKFLFLAGKSVHAIDCRNGGSNYADCLVPTIGYPCCDVMFTSYLNYANMGTPKPTMVPAIPTGRISAKTPADMMAYLSKVTEYEHQPDSAWMKRVLHFAGGDAANNFNAILSAWQAIIQKPFFGASVSTFSKLTAAPISITTSDTLTMLINTGVSLMTFFGHSSGQVWDEGIAQPSSYNNQGKYPFILSNGCYAGDIHTDYTSLATSTNSEIFALTPERGAIGFIAETSLGLVNVLQSYSTSIYNRISFSLYGQPIGKCMQAAVKDNLISALSDLTFKAGILEMTLEGDPAIIPNSSTLPDYAISPADIVFDSKSNPSFLQVIITEHDLTKAINKSYVVELDRTYPNGSVVTKTAVRLTPLNQDTIMTFKFAIDPTKDPGTNKFKVTLNADPINPIPELSRTNNVAEADLDMLGNSILPVYPYNFAIVPVAPLMLKASTINALNQKFVSYKFQFDTTDTYSSPFMQSTSILSQGGVIDWTPPKFITGKDSVVYFWRVSAPLPDTSWREFSFQVVKGKRGWSQANFFQFKNDGYQYVSFVRKNRNFQFVNSVINIYTTTSTYTYQHTPGIAEYNQYSLNSFQEEDAFCNYATFTFAVINPSTGEPWSHGYLYTTPGGEDRGPDSCLYCGYATPPGVPVDHTRIRYSFDFDGVDSIHPASYINQLFKTIPYGYYVLCYSQNAPHNFSYPAGSATNTIVPALSSIGVSTAALNSISPAVPFIFFGQKQKAGSLTVPAKVTVGVSDTSLIQQKDSILTKWNAGYILSPIFGPGKTWDSLYWKEFPEAVGYTDSLRLGIIGITNTGVIDTLVGSVTKPGLTRSSSKIGLRNIVNPVTYPYIQLIAYMSSQNVHNTPPQLKEWQVIYTPVPELAINPLATSAYKIKNDTTVSQGDSIRYTYPIQNISEYNFTGNLILSAYIQNSNGAIHNFAPRYLSRPLLAGKFVMDTIWVKTLGMQNTNSLWVEVNPVGLPKTQPEQYHFNNIANFNFTVQVDKTNPLLDVTFDGIHILNQDIVSAKPNILMKLTDENKFLALNDTSEFAVFLTPPSGVQQRIPFGNQLTFTKAVLPNNSCLVHYTPVFTKDGMYTLTVQAVDRSKNSSGGNYQIQFEVIRESSITAVMNYPNPFSTSTRFVFTLTGSVLPDNFKIQILTITGKVVKEINKEELGPIHIGRNITQYAWDGRDTYGSLLGIGTYLYRVQTRLDGASMQSMASGADAYFTNGYGKMTLIR